MRKLTPEVHERLAMSNELTFRFEMENNARI
jgi:hypothetical protein